MLLINEAKEVKILLLADSGLPVNGVVAYVVYDENDAVFAGGNMVQIGAVVGFYTMTFTPDAAGTWTVKFTCAAPVRNAIIHFDVGMGVEQSILGATVILLSRLTAARAGYLDNLISTETAGTYAHPNGVAEQNAVVITPAELTRYFDLYLDMNNLAQITIVRIYVKVDGANYRLVESAVFPTDFESNVKSVVIGLSPSSKGMKVTLQSSVAEGAGKNVPYFYIKKSEN